MKLAKTLTVNGSPVGLVSEHIALDLSTPGRADFTVRSSAPLSGIVHYAFGDTARGQMVDLHIFSRTSK